MAQVAEGLALIVRIEIWSDVVCPWCYVGKARLERAVVELTEAGTPVAVDVVFRAYQLDPNVPAEGQPLDAYLARKFGRADALAAMRTRLDEAADGLGIAFRWDGMVRRNTRDAHRLLAWALRTEGSAAQVALKDRLLRAHFTEQADVADHAALGDLAAEVGLDGGAAAAALASGSFAEEVRDDQAKAHQQGITAVPTFVVEGRYLLQGALEPEKWRRALPTMAEELANT